MFVTFCSVISGDEDDAAAICCLTFRSETCLVNVNNFVIDSCLLSKNSVQFIALNFNFADVALTHMKSIDYSNDVDLAIKVKSLKFMLVGRSLCGRLDKSRCSFPPKEKTNYVYSFNSDKRLKRDDGLFDFLMILGLLVTSRSTP